MCKGLADTGQTSRHENYSLIGGRLDTAEEMSFEDSNRKLRNQEAGKMHVLEPPGHYTELPFMHSQSLREWRKGGGKTEMEKPPKTFPI
jgi:hypothetical protein